MVLFHIGLLSYSYGKSPKSIPTISFSLAYHVFLSRSDFIYMVPPFLAYYGVITRNRTILAESYNQIKLYRNYLFDPTESLWRHVSLGVNQNDEGFWSTGTAINLLTVQISLIF
jgi:hypothetical protein